jgi:hypothetical protein
MLERSHQQLSLLRVLHQIGCRFGHGQCDLADLDIGESEPLRNLACGATCFEHLAAFLDIEAQLRMQKQRPFVWELTAVRISTPTLDGDTSSGPDLRDDIELVRESFRAPEAKAQTGTARITVLQRELDVGNAGAAIGEREADAATLALRYDLERRFTASAV